jgi:hypothetical protein
MSEGARLQPHEAIYRSWREERIRVDLALAPQGWEPVQTSFAPRAFTITDTFQTNDRWSPSQPSVPMSDTSDRWEAWAAAVDLLPAFRAVVSLLLGAAIVLLLVLAYQAETR